MMMTEIYNPPSVLAASMGIAVDDNAIMDQRMELHKQREERMQRKLRKDMEKMKKKEAEVVKVGLMVIPDKTGDQQIMHEYQWWEEEMRRREEQRVKQQEKEAHYQAQVDELQAKEQQLDMLKSMWQEKMDTIRLGEEELEKVQKEFESQLQSQLQSMQQSSSSQPALSTQSRMKAEADRRAVRKTMKMQGEDEAQKSRSLLLQQIEEKNLLEREILRVQKDAGLIRQRLTAQEKSQNQSMEAETTRRSNQEPRTLPSLEELYAPKVVPPRPFIPRSHNARMQAEAEARAARRHARAQQLNNNNGSSSSSAPGSASN